MSLQGCFLGHAIYKECEIYVLRKIAIRTIKLITEIMEIVRKKNED